MAFLIPFANALQPPKADRTQTGGLHSVIPAIQPVAVRSTVASPANALLLYGDASGTSVTWNEYTSEANSQAVNDLPVFNGAGDLYYVAFSDGDVVESLDWYISTAGVYTGTVTTTIIYRNASGSLVEHTNVVTPSFTSTGLKRLMLPVTIDYAQLGEMDDPRNPSNARQRAVVVKFNGIVSATTNPIASQFWKRRTATANKVVTNFDALVNNADKSPFNAVTVLPLAGDRALYGYSSKLAVQFANVVRTRPAAYQTQMIYSTADGVYSDYPNADIEAASGSDTGLWQAGTGNFADVFMPQSDWAKTSITDSTGDVTQAYWQGFRYTADAVQPELISQYSLWGALLGGATTSGAYSAETASYTQLEVFARQPVTVETWLVIANKRTQQTATVKLTSTGSYSRSPINFSVASGDEIVVQVVKGDPLFNAADGMIRLS